MNIGAVVGRLTRDMEFIPYENKANGNKGYRARGTVAVDREGRVGKNGEKQVDFIPVQTWINETQKEKFFDIYMKKGAKISVNGSIRVESYTDKNNQNKTFTVVEGRMALVEAFKGNGETQQNGNQGFQNNQYQNQNNKYQNSQTPQQPQEPQGFEPVGYELADEDIPF